jgi:hypothetical protein
MPEKVAIWRPADFARVLNYRIRLESLVDRGGKGWLISRVIGGIKGWKWVVRKIYEYGGD